VSWSGPEYRWIFEWIFYLSLVWAIVSICREGWSNQAALIRRLKMIEPSHVIIVGLVIAGIGVVWQLRAAPLPDPKIALLQSQVDALKQQLAAPKPVADQPSAPVESASTRPPPHLSEKVAPALRRIRTIIHYDLLGAASGASVLTKKFDSIMPPGFGSDGGIDRAAYQTEFERRLKDAYRRREEQLLKLQSDIKGGRDKIGAVTIEYRDYADQINPLIEGTWPGQKFDDSVTNYIMFLRWLLEMPGKSPQMIFDTYNQQLEENLQSYTLQLKQVSATIDGKIAVMERAQ
jgi:hypothetical protein